MFYPSSFYAKKEFWVSWNEESVSLEPKNTSYGKLPSASYSLLRKEEDYATYAFADGHDVDLSYAMLEHLAALGVISVSTEYHAPLLAELLDRFNRTNTLEDNDIISLETELSGVGDDFQLTLTAGLLDKIIDAAYSKGYADKDF